jgi:hypothetical protein
MGLPVIEPSAARYIHSKVTARTVTLITFVVRRKRCSNQVKVGH